MPQVCVDAAGFPDRTLPVDEGEQKQGAGAERSGGHGGGAKGGGAENFRPQPACRQIGEARTDQGSAAGLSMKPMPRTLSIIGVSSRRIDLASQLADVHVHQVRFWYEPIIPDIFQQHRSGDHLARPPHQVFQKLEFARAVDQRRGCRVGPHGR